MDAEADGFIGASHLIQMFKILDMPISEQDAVMLIFKIHGGEESDRCSA